MKAPLFLRAKHWQIFVPLIAIPFITMIVFMVMMVINISADQPGGPNDVFFMLDVMPVLFILCAGTQFLWMWNVAVNLRKYIHSTDRKPRVKLFRITFFFPLVYMIILPMIMKGFMNEIFRGNNSHPENVLPFFLMIFFGHMTMMFCLLNNNYVVTKTIKMAELQRKVTFGDFVGDFFFMLVFPVAIWFFQPRINKIVNGENENPSLGESKIQSDLLD